jgi:hypothetical protein
MEFLAGELPGELPLNPYSFLRSRPDCRLRLALDLSPGRSYAPECGFELGEEQGDRELG